MMELTPWFDGKTQKPARRGVYMLMSGPRIGFQKWDGIAWGPWDSTPENANRARKGHYADFCYQHDNWRGLACKQPNVRGEAGPKDAQRP